MRRLIVVSGSIALAVLILFVGVGRDSAQAHYRVNWERWYFGGFTHKSTAGTGQSRVDPVSIMFWGWGTATNANVMSHVNDEWNHAVLEWWTAMDDWGCLTRIGPHVTGTQYMVFKSLDDYASGSGQPQISWDEFDWTMSSNRSCTNQYHMRMWDDLEHDWHTNSHNANNWLVGNIHHDKWTTDGWHRLDQPWDRAPWKLLRKLDEHCSYFKWRQIAGTKRFQQGKWNDGYVTLILMRHVDAPGPCPKRP